MDAVDIRRNDDAAGGGVPAGPMGEIVARERDARDFDRLLRVGDVERDDAMNRWDALDEIVANDGGDAACAAGKTVDEGGFGAICRNAGDVFEAAGVGLDEDRAVGRTAGLFGIGMGSKLRARLEECGLEQLEVGETPDLIGASRGLESAHG